MTDRPKSYQESIGNFILQMLLWLLGLPYLLVGIVYIQFGTPVGGFIFMVGGCLLLPPIRDLVFTLTKIKIHPVFRVILVVILTLVAGSFIQNDYEARFIT